MLCIKIVYDFARFIWLMIYLFSGLMKLTFMSPKVIFIIVIKISIVFTIKIELSIAYSW